MVQLGSAGAADLALAPDLASASDGAAPSDLAAADLRAIADLAPPVLAFDDFKRPNQALWGTATDGQAWAGATSSAFSVENDTGVIATGSLSQDAVATLGPAAADEQLLLTGSIDNFSANNIEAGIRVQDATNFYRVMITGGNLVVRRVANGSGTNLGSTPFSANTNTAYDLRAQVVGKHDLGAGVAGVGQRAEHVAGDGHRRGVRERPVRRVGDERWHGQLEGDAVRGVAALSRRYGIGAGPGQPYCTLTFVDGDDFSVSHAAPCSVTVLVDGSYV